MARVRQKHEAYPRVVLPILEAIGGISQTFLATLAEMDQESEKSEKHYRWGNIGVVNSLYKKIAAVFFFSHLAFKTRQ